MCEVPKGGIRMKNIIHIFGASGSGTTTLAQEMERRYGFKCLDTDDYFWLPTQPPYTSVRPLEERLSLMKKNIEENATCVLFGSLCGWGDVFIPKFDLVVFVYAPANIRTKRLEKRERARFGGRIDKGGDMHENHVNFIAWAGNYDTLKPPERCKDLHEEWLARMNCPVLRLDGTKPVAVLITQIKRSLGHV